MTVEEWSSRKVRDFAVRAKTINVEGTLLPPLSITKGRGVVLQSEKYKKQIATDLKKYVVARRDQFAFDPMSLYYGAIGRVASIEIGLVSPDYVVFDVDDTVDKTFLNYLLRSPEQVAVYETVAETGNQFGKRRRVYWSVFEELALTLPPREEQRRIATVLSAMDVAIDATQAVIDQLHVVRKAMMTELLTRGLPGRKTRFKDTEVGRLPESWSVLPLSGVLDGIDAGWSPQCVPEPAGPDQWGVLKVSAVSWGTFQPEENKRLPDGVIAKPELEVRSGDVIISRANTPNLVGRSAIVRATRPKLLLSDKLLRLRLDPGLVVPAFVNYVLGSVSVRTQIEDGATGSSRSMKNISQETLRSLTIPVPQLDEQHAIVAVADELEKRGAVESEYIASLQTLKASVMSVLLKGEARVPPDQAIA